MAGALPAAEQWVQPTPNGVGYILQDPISGERMSPNAVPSYIKDDPLLYAGVSYLQGRAEDVTVTIGYGAHKSAEDLGAVEGAGGWFERQVLDADYYGYESRCANSQVARGLRVRAKRLLMDAVSIDMTLDAYVQVAEADEFFSQLNTFSHRSLRAVAGSNTPSFVVDVVRDHSPTEQSLAQRIDEAEQATPGELVAVGHLALENAREWCMVAHTGLEVMKGEMGVEPRPVKVFETVGAGHEDLTRKYRMLGTVVKPKLICPARWDRDFAKAISGTLASGVIVPEDLPAIKEFQQMRYDSWSIARQAS